MTVIWPRAAIGRFTFRTGGWIRRWRRDGALFGHGAWRARVVVATSEAKQPDRRATRTGVHRHGRRDARLHPRAPGTARRRARPVDRSPLPHAWRRCDRRRRHPSRGRRRWTGVRRPRPVGWGPRNRWRVPTPAWGAERLAARARRDDQQRDADALDVGRSVRRAAVDRTESGRRK